MHGIHSPYASCDSSEVSRLRSESSGPASVRTASDVDSAGCSGGGLQLRPGMRVTLQKCKNPQHDGKQAMVLEYVVHAGNWRVELDTAVVIRVVEENCLVEEEIMDEHPPLGEGRPFDLCDTPDMSVQSQDPYTMRRNDLAASRFFRVQERMAKEFSSPGIFESSHVEVCDDTESIFFKLNTKWDKGRKALFAKCYTKLYVRTRCLGGGGGTRWIPSALLYSPLRVRVKIGKQKKYQLFFLHINFSNNMLWATITLLFQQTQVQAGQPKAERHHP